MLGNYCDPKSEEKYCVDGQCGAFLPKVLYNRRDKRWVMWWSCLTCSVATAATPWGPWTIANYNVTYGSGKVRRAASALPCYPLALSLSLFSLALSLSLSRSLFRCAGVYVFWFFFESHPDQSFQPFAV